MRLEDNGVGSAVQTARHILSRIDNILFVCAGAVLVLMVIHIITEAILRFLGVVNSLQAIVIVAAWYMVAVIFLAMPRTAHTVGHISVDLVTKMMSPAMQNGSAIMARLLTIAYVAFLFVLNTQIAIERTHTGELWETSTGYIAVWPSRWLLPIGFGLMTLGYLLFRMHHKHSDGGSNEL